MNKPAKSCAGSPRPVPHDAPAAFLSLLHAFETMDDAGRRALHPVVSEMLEPFDRDARIIALMSGESPEDSIRRALLSMYHDA